MSEWPAGWARGKDTDEGTQPDPAREDPTLVDRTGMDRPTRAGTRAGRTSVDTPQVVRTRVDQPGVAPTRVDQPGVARTRVDQPGVAPTRVDQPGDARTRVDQPGVARTRIEPAAADAPARPPGPLLPPRRRRRPGRARLLLRWASVLIPLLLALLLVFYLALGAWTTSRLQHVDALANYPGRPADARGQTWLLVGSDSREGLTKQERSRLRTGNTAGRRTDTILLLNIPPGGRPSLVSLPRDSYLTIPAYTPPSGTGHARAAHQDKLNSAYSLGGPALLVRSVESATGLRVDHYMEVGFAGVVDVVDAVGGVDITVDRPIKDAKAGLDVKAGRQTMDGPTALGYVRTRYTDPRGDLGRIERQQRFLSALVHQAASPGTLLNPVATTRLAAAGTEAVRLDGDSGPIDLTRAAGAMRKVSNGEGTATTVPVADPDYASPVGSAVLWNAPAAQALFASLRAGKAPPASG